MKNEKLLTDLTDEQCEKVVGGVGRVFEGGSPAGAGVNGWFGGTPPGNGAGLAGSAGFTAPGVLNPNSAVPVRVPGPK